MGKIILITTCDNSCPYFERFLGKRCKNPKTLVDGKPRRILESEYDHHKEFPLWCELEESSDYEILTGKDAKALYDALNRPPVPETEEKRRERQEFEKEFAKGMTICDKCGQVDWDKGWVGQLDLKLNEEE